METYMAKVLVSYGKTEGTSTFNFMTKCQDMGAIETGLFQELTLLFDPEWSKNSVSPLLWIFVQNAFYTLIASIQYDMAGPDLIFWYTADVSDTIAHAGYTIEFQEKD